MVDMGPLISSNHRNVVEGFVQRALSEGIQAIWGGEKGSGDGFTYLPTAFTMSRLPRNCLPTKYSGRCSR